jgi:hypothetical protein
MRGACIECCEVDDLHPGSGLCEPCANELLARELQRDDDAISGLASYEAEAFGDLLEFEVDGNGILS